MLCFGEIKLNMNVLWCFFFEHNIVTLYCKRERTLTTCTIPILNIETKKESRLCIRSFSVLILRLLSLHLQVFIRPTLLMRK